MPSLAEDVARAGTAPNRTPQVVINRQNGAEFEQQVIDALGPVGGVKNTTPRTVTLSNGTEVTTIPDLWGRNVGGVLEAKNVQNLSLSPQLRAQAQIAREAGEPMNLVVSPRTQRVSGPLLNDVRSTGGNVYVYNPATDSLTPW
jgi:filamentous hemagglutinin